MAEGLFSGFLAGAQAVRESANSAVDRRVKRDINARAQGTYDWEMETKRLVGLGSRLRAFTRNPDGTPKDAKEYIDNPEFQKVLRETAGSPIVRENVQNPNYPGSQTDVTGVVTDKTGAVALGVRVTGKDGELIGEGGLTQHRTGEPGDKLMSIHASEVADWVDGIIAQAGGRDEKFRAETQEMGLNAIRLNEANELSDRLVSGGDPSTQSGGLSTPGSVPGAAPATAPVAPVAAPAAPQAAPPADNMRVLRLLDELEALKQGGLATAARPGNGAGGQRGTAGNQTRIDQIRAELARLGVAERNPSIQEEGLMARDTLGSGYDGSADGIPRMLYEGGKGVVGGVADFAKGLFGVAPAAPAAPAPGRKQLTRESALAANPPFAAQPAAQPTAGSADAPTDAPVPPSIQGKYEAAIQAGATPEQARAAVPRLAIGNGKNQISDEEMRNIDEQRGAPGAAPVAVATNKSDPAGVTVRTSSGESLDLPGPGKRMDKRGRQALAWLFADGKLNAEQFDRGVRTSRLTKRDLSAIATSTGALIVDEEAATLQFVDNPAQVALAQAQVAAKTRMSPTELIKFQQDRFNYYSDSLSDKYATKEERDAVAAKHMDRAAFTLDWNHAGGVSPQMMALMKRVNIILDKTERNEGESYWPFGIGDKTVSIPSMTSGLYAVLRDEPGNALSEPYTRAYKLVNGDEAKMRMILETANEISQKATDPKGNMVTFEDALKMSVAEYAKKPK